MQVNFLYKNMYPADFGPIYTETIMGRFPVEPFNTFSNLIFLVIVIWFSFRIRQFPSRYPLILVILPILFIGFIGGTVFHATRSSRVWLIMDFMPIFILAMLAAYHFWLALSKSRTIAFFGMLSPILLSYLLRTLLGNSYQLGISLGYASLALALLLPIFLLCRSEKWRGLVYLLSAVGTFSLALFFRIIDKDIGAKVFPMGTHFLWHIFGGVSVGLLLQYVILQNEFCIEKTEAANIPFQK